MDANIIMTQFTYSAVVVWGMQRLKSASWFPLLQAGQAKLSRSVSVIAAFFGHAGISYVWDPSIDASGMRHLAIAIPTLWGAVLLMWHWLGQYVMQEMVYQAAANKQPADKP